MEWDELRGFRDEYLAKMNKYQLVLVHATLTNAQKTELAAYRIELLNLPQDYDTADEAYTNFPERPSWMK